MSKLLIDTNIALDLLAKREPFHESAAQLFSLADKHKLKLTTQTLTDLLTIYNYKKKLEGHTIAFCGDLKYLSECYHLTIRLLIWH